MDISALGNRVVAQGTPATAGIPAPPASQEPTPAKAAAPAPAAPRAEPARKPAAEPDRTFAEDLAKRLKEVLTSRSSSLEFSVNQDLDRVMIRVVDSQTQQLIRQIPSEEMVQIALALDQFEGLLVRQKA